MKNKYKGLGVFGTFLGMWLSRNFGNNKYFGLDGRMLILLFAILLITACIISMIIKKILFNSIFKFNSNFPYVCRIYRDIL
ncbi:hypothetical protein CSC2_05100 [Clostridium zeae]|uniref:Uncharacterized protein n=1 Tax=Clostridium zeae TaxID=2759022 RepID=A0ABQ1E5I0_9CLOT|nr:hypothetical protein CSC2_05100 [Clostridium zeae]